MKRKSGLLFAAVALTAIPLQQRNIIADQDVTLPDPIYLETFDELQELELPNGWSVTNDTTTATAGDNIDDLNSDTYKNWVVVSADRLSGLKGRIFNLDPITLNGQTVDALATGNLIYAESDVRDGNQIQYLFTKDYDLTGKSNVYAAFHSLYEQNQDNINGMEYSIDGGTTWLPALYYLNDKEGTPDIVVDSLGNIDLDATLNTARSDQAQAKAFSAFMAAPYSPELAAYIQGREDDNQTDGKRIEIVRLAKADNQAKVRFRFFQAGTGSWYWGIDDLGLYSIETPRVAIAPYVLPNYGHNAQANLGGSVTFNVDATGKAPLTYQWSHDGVEIAGATGATLVVNNAQESSAGAYTVTVKNSLGEVTSDPANLSIIAAPQIGQQPSGALVSSGAPFSLSVTATGPAPITYQWQKDSQDIAGATSATYSVAKAAVSDAGVYTVVVTNPKGSTTSEPAQVKVFDGAITQDLVVHLPLDSSANDTSGKNNNGTPESQFLADGTDPGLPTFTAAAAARIGSGALNIKDGQSINLGTPEDLFFSGDVDFSVSFWVKAADANAWTGDPSFFSNKNWGSGASQGYVIAAQDNGAWKWNYRAADGARHDVGFPSIADNVWHNIIITHDRTGYASFYVDGEKKNQEKIADEGDIDSFDLNTYIGQDGTGAYGFNNDQGAHFKNILMDDFGIWRRTLTPQEAASIYAHGLAGEDLTKASGEVAGDIRIATIEHSGANITLTVDGAGNFQLQKKTSLTDATWTNVGAPSSSGTFTVPADGAAGFFRVQKQ